VKFLLYWAVPEGDPEVDPVVGVAAVGVVVIGGVLVGVVVLGVLAAGVVPVVGKVEEESVDEIGVLLTFTIVL